MEVWNKFEIVYFRCFFFEFYMIIVMEKGQNVFWMIQIKIKRLYLEDDVIGMYYYGEFYRDEI